MNTHIIPIIKKIVICQGCKPKHKFVHYSRNGKPKLYCEKYIRDMNRKRGIERYKKMKLSNRIKKYE